MKRLFVPLLVATFLFAVWMLPCAPLTASQVSPVAVAADKSGTRAYVAAAGARKVLEIDLQHGRVSADFPVRGVPTGMVLSPDEKFLYVTLSGAGRGQVALLNLVKRAQVAAWEAGHEPVSPVLSPDGKTLFVCNRFDDSVSALDLTSGRVAYTVAVARQPIAAAIARDGGTLFVANHLPLSPANAARVGALVSVIGTASHEVTSQIELPDGATAIRGIALSPDGRHLYVTHILARHRIPTTQLERGWMNSNALSVIDARRATLLGTVLLDDVDRGAANPWAVACTPDGRLVCITHAGTNELSVIDALGLLNKVMESGGVSKLSKNPENAPYEAVEISNDLTFLVGLRQRIPLSVQGPRAMAVAGSKVVVSGYFSDTLEIFAGSEGWKQQAAVVLGAGQPMDEVRRGEMLFNDASRCVQNWQSCASCHPDTRADGLNWDLLNDGIGNPKNVKSLLLAHRTPPATVTGARTDAEKAVRAGIRHILFASWPERDATAIDRYLRSLVPVPSPRLVNGKLSAAAGRGKAIFLAARCADCHPAPLYTDMKKHDVGIGTGADAGREFDTPTLVEVWRTAPYLYDGRAVTMREALTEYNVRNRHGVTSNLNEQEMNDLIDFVLSL